MMDVELIEDHDQALACWRRRGLRGHVLLHIDAHIDFALPAAERPQAALSAAKNLGELKAGLEASLALLRYTKDFGRQTNIGNYIYSAWEEGIVRDIYWVIPGEKSELRRNSGLLGRILRSSLGRAAKPEFFADRVSCRFRDITVSVCTLDVLPVLRNPLLDIDVDFMVTDSIRHADNTDQIGRRRVCCAPELLLTALGKIERPAVATIAYSTNGGYTPTQYRHLGDRLACLLNPSCFAARWRRSSRAAGHFEEFLKSGSKAAYWRAVGFNAAYRGPDNSTGMLYMESGLKKSARREFVKILAVDPKNPQALLGMGQLALCARRFSAARRLLGKALPQCRGRFKGLKADVLQNLGESCLALGRLEAAEGVFRSLRRAEPLRPLAHYFCAEVFRKRKSYRLALDSYGAALQLGLRSPSLKAAMRACARHIPGAIINESLSRRARQAAGTKR